VLRIGETALDAADVLLGKLFERSGCRLVCGADIVSGNKVEPVCRARAQGFGSLTRHCQEDVEY
jgi:hypothetical protein